MTSDQQILGKFYTPLPVARAIVATIDQELNKPPEHILEPSVGGGAFVIAACERWPDAHVTGIDIDRDAPGLGYCNSTFINDFESLAIVGPAFDLVLGNPPFSVYEWRRCGKRGAKPKSAKIDQEKIRQNESTGLWEKLVKREVASAHVRNCLKFTAPAGRVALLLRAAFLHPADRDDLIDCLDFEFKISPRIPFNEDGGADNSEYSCFLWRNVACGLRGVRRLVWDKPSKRIAGKAEE